MITINGPSQPGLQSHAHPGQRNAAYQSRQNSAPAPFFCSIVRISIHDSNGVMGYAR